MAGSGTKTPWLKTMHPSTELVQKAYVNARVHALDKLADKLRTETIAELTKVLALKKGVKVTWNKKEVDGYWSERYDLLSINLKAADLTINFDPKGWFDTENKFTTYAQVYERSFKDGELKMYEKEPKKNPVVARVAADDRVTTPTEWIDMDPAVARGLAPGAAKERSIYPYMVAGQRVTAIGDSMQGLMVESTDASQTKYYQSPQKHFDPMTKQVFAALNYGMRRSGGCTFYGKSHFVLSDKFKEDAIYFAGDTFYIGGTTEQVSYNTIGGLYLKAKQDLRDAMISSCFMGIPHEDTSEAKYLVEAHLFQPLEFASGVTEMHLEKGLDSKYKANAKKFCDRWNIKLHLKD